MLIMAKNALNRYLYYHFSHKVSDFAHQSLNQYARSIGPCPFKHIAVTPLIFPISFPGETASRTLQSTRNPYLI